MFVAAAEEVVVRGIEVEAFVVVRGVLVADVLRLVVLVVRLEVEVVRMVVLLLVVLIGRLTGANRLVVLEAKAAPRTGARFCRLTWSSRCSRSLIVSTGEAVVNVAMKQKDSRKQSRRSFDELDRVDMLFAS